MRTQRYPLLYGRAICVGHELAVFARGRPCTHPA
jgi:hypothetical protein